jgi:colanic acid biosynthesis glycosyl transferase WcaI
VAYPSHDRNPIRRVANYLSFAVSAALFGVPRADRPDIIYAYHPPATIGIPAMRLARKFDVPFVLDIQDLWPDTVAVTGMLSARPILALLNRFCHLVYRRATHIAVLSAGMRRTLVARGVPEDRLTVIHNWTDVTSHASSAQDQDLRTQLGLQGRFVVLFAGTMGLAQSLDTVLQAAALCEVSHPLATFVFVGGGVERERLRTSAQGRPNVVFLDRVPPDRMGPLFTMSDAVLVHLRDDPLFEITIPSKTQAYMAAGRPIVMAVRGDAAELVRAAGAGVACEPENPESLVGALDSLMRMNGVERAAMGAAGLAYYESHLSLQHGVDAFERVFQHAIARHRDASRSSSSVLT